jgi:tRNA modification GTPase
VTASREACYSGEAMLRPGSLDDTIVAPATAAGEAAVAIVRLSGPRARAIGEAVAPPRRERRSHRFYRARLEAADGSTLDEGLVVEMHAPHSYTGEDVVELHTHGAPVVVEAVLAACLAAGARLAEAGEYTARAFLRGRLDLAQAEAVGDLIAASGLAQQRIATAQLEGSLSRAVSDLVTELEGVLAAFRAVLDFPEQVTDPDRLVSEQAAPLAHARVQLGALVEQARLDLGRRRHVVLSGAPNAGKSSLLNALVGERRVLVHATPGTTRDPVEVELAVGIARLSVWDTAGLRPEAEGLERDGIELAWERVARADLVLWLLAAETPLWPSPELAPRAIVVGSKADLVSAARRAELETEAAARGQRVWGWVSSRSGEGVSRLRAWLGEVAPLAAASGVVVVRERHLEALRLAGEALGRSSAGLTDGLTLDVLAVEVEEATRQLGHILGRDVELEVLDRIFADFCLGK